MNNTHNNSLREFRFDSRDDHSYRNNHSDYHGKNRSNHYDRQSPSRNRHVNNDYNRSHNDFALDKEYHADVSLYKTIGIFNRGIPFFSKQYFGAQLRIRTNSQKYQKAHVRIELRNRIIDKTYYNKYVIPLEIPLEEIVGEGIHVHVTCYYRLNLVDNKPVEYDRFLKV